MNIRNEPRIDALSIAFALALMAATVAGGVAAFMLGFAEAASVLPMVDGAGLASL